MCAVSGILLEPNLLAIPWIYLAICLKHHAVLKFSKFNSAVYRVNIVTVWARENWSDLWNDTWVKDTVARLKGASRLCRRLQAMVSRMLLSVLYNQRSKWRLQRDGDGWLVVVSLPGNVRSKINIGLSCMPNKCPSLRVPDVGRQPRPIFRVETDAM